MNERGHDCATSLFNACLAIFLGALALYGAVHLLLAVWVPLSIAIFVVTVVGGIGLTIHRKMRRW
jgi:hypothetical protein